MVTLNGTSGFKGNYYEVSKVIAIMGMAPGFWVQHRCLSTTEWLLIEYCCLMTVDREEAFSLLSGHFLVEINENLVMPYWTFHSPDMTSDLWPVVVFFQQNHGKAVMWTLIWKKGCFSLTPVTVGGETKYTLQLQGIRFSEVLLLCWRQIWLYWLQLNVQGKRNLEGGIMQLLAGWKCVHQL